MKICLAGTTVLEANKNILQKSKYILESFYSIKDWQIPIIKKCDLFLLDSGAFTFMNSYKSEVNWKEYINRYADFIIKNDIKYFFELDIDVLIGYEKVKEYTKYLEEKTRRRCIPVWHKSRGLEEWKRLTKEYDYVAIGGIVTKEITRKDYPVFKQLLKIAKKNNCKVHGLGFTATKELSKYRFYSVDSTSWNGITRFNAYDKYINNRIVRVPKNSRRIKKEERNNALVYSFNEWLKMQNYADKYL